MNPADEPIWSGRSPGARRSFHDLADAVAPFAERCEGQALARLEATVLDDMVTEYDARFLSSYLLALPIEFTPAFLQVEARWALDEARHYLGFRAVNDRCFPFDPALLEQRVPDFGGLEHLFEDEFSILCLFAYDELATVRGYRANLERYNLLGPRMDEWIRCAIADEAWHYSGFLRVIEREHAHRAPEGAEIVRRIRACEGGSYTATFILDREDPIYGSEIFDEAARVLTRQLERLDRTRAGA